MDFGALLHYAKKKNDAVCKTEGKYYSTKYAPPKKESKESRQLSNNIQKFLKNREAEEQQRKREEREKLNNLLALRDEKSKNKIRKMLKVTKSANKSVLEDANGDNTAMDGADQPDGDDYGYVSTEANAFYQKYIEKVKDVQEDKGFAPSRPQSVRDLSSTKERVKAAITREREEARTHTRQRTSHASSSSISRTTTDKDGMVSRGYNTSSSKTLYDPDAERREEERKRREEEQKKTKVKRATQPPPMDFQALLRLAEKKQHEPVDLALPEKKKEPERLMSAREKKEQEERQRWKEQRAQRERQREIDAKTKVEPTRMEPGGRIPKLNRTTPVGKVASASMPPPSPQKSKLTSDTPKRPASASPSGSSSAKYSAVTTKSSTNQSVTKRLSVASSSSSSSNGTTKPAVRAPVSAASAAPSQAKTATNYLKQAAPSRNPYADVNKTGATRSFPPREPSKQIRSGPQGNSPCIKPHSAETRGREGAGGGGAGAGAQRRLVEQINKNRIYDDDSEYDSELDDFIDDGDCEEDISSHIRDIFGYDKRRYRDLDDDDAQMESSFAQVQREEFISKKLGLQEDLEDMRMEAMHKKRKIDKKRPARIHDD